ncbi:MAG: hypothetical protein ACYDHG_18710, partial [Desulfomonilaceae bacterium]
SWNGSYFPLSRAYSLASRAGLELERNVRSPNRHPKGSPALLRLTYRSLMSRPGNSAVNGMPSGGVQGRN